MAGCSICFSSPCDCGEPTVGLTSRHYVGDSCLGGHAEEAQQGFKFDAGKLRYELIPPSSLAELAKIYTDGAQKYGDENYLKGMSWRRVMASIIRHIEAARAGVLVDPESGSPPLAHAAWGCFTLMLYQKYNLGENDLVSEELRYD